MLVYSVIQNTRTRDTMISKNFPTTFTSKDWTDSGGTYSVDFRRPKIYKTFPFIQFIMKRRIPLTLSVGSRLAPLPRVPLPVAKPQQASSGCA